MKILCLHGSGTNTQIFEAQTAAIRHELGGHHEYEFVQGTISWPLAEGLQSLSSPNATYWSYSDWESADSHVAALDQLDAYIAAEGPFNGVMGFSNGAGLAAMHIIRKSIESPAAKPPFKFAVLFSCTYVYDPVAYFEKGGRLRAMKVEDDGEIVKIPVVNVWGAQDERRVESEQFSKLCQGNLRSVIVHEGGHEVPGLGAKDGVAPAVKAIRRVMTLTTENQ